MSRGNAKLPFARSRRPNRQSADDHRDDRNGSDPDDLHANPGDGGEGKCCL